VTILIVDDDRELRELIGFVLRGAGYPIIEAGDGLEALRQHAAGKPDLVILDVNLPGIDGFEVCRRIRVDSDTPVMMLTVRGEEADQVRGLDLGADDYLAKPFSPRALLARVRALLRRRGPERPAPVGAGAIVLDPDLQTVSVGGAAPVRLTNLEFRFLQAMVATPGDPRFADMWGLNNGGQSGGQQMTQSNDRQQTGLSRRSQAAPALWTSPFSFMRRFGEDMDRLFEDFGFAGMQQGFAQIASGDTFTMRDLHPAAAAALDTTTDQYRFASVRYDLSKLRAKGLVEKVPHSRRYRLRPQGYMICVVFLKLFERVYAPLTAGLLRPVAADARLAEDKRHQLDQLYQRVVTDLDALLRAVGLKTAA